MPKHGKIPDQLRVFLKNTSHYKRKFGAPVECRPAFVTDIEKPKTHETARYWARGYGSYNPGATGCAEPETVDLDNKPIPFVTLIGHESRGEGGEAYKVITPEGWLVDLRDEFYEVLFTKGIPKSGRMTGPFIWVVNGSQMRLTLIGSALHKEIEALDKVRRKPRQGKIKIKDLVKGGVYRNRGGGCDAIYLGRCRLWGKLKCAWLYLAGLTGSTGSPQGVYEREVAKPEPWVLLTNGCSYTEEIGKVNLKPSLRDSPNAEHVQFEDGYGSRLLRHAISEW